MERTAEFREAVTAKQAAFPPPKRQRKPPHSAVDDNWTKQAEQVATNLRSFSHFLASIRRAYIDLSSSSSSSSAHSSSQPRPPLDPAKGLAAWEGVKWLSDKERDEIDFGVKVALRKSVDRVRELEAVEKARVAAEARLDPNNSLIRLLGLPLSSSASPSSESLASHRSCVTHYLNSLLAQVSQHQKDQQETRVQRQLERSATLGGLGGGGALGMEEYARKQAEKSKSDWTMGKGKGKATEKVSGGENGIGDVPSIYRPAPLPPRPSTSSDPLFEEEEPLLSEELTPLQIQQFEAEESALLKATQSDLESLKLAKSSLLEISSLQSQLAIHLTQQAELTDKLWEEAVGVTGKVEEGNVQLKKARERNRESRMWLLIFLMLSSLTLLFLDYYS